MSYHPTTFKLLMNVAAFLLSATVASATIPGLCNTGLTNGSGVCTGPLVTADSGTTNDANWTIATPYPTAASSSPIPNPCGAATQCNPALTFVPAWVDFPDPAWLANSAVYSATASEWITHQTELSLGGYYVYATTFQSLQPTVT